MVQVHVLNVGKGSSTWIDLPNRLTVIDIDDCHAQSDFDLTDPLDFYRRNFAGQPIFRFILTHPDMDHLSGLNELASIAHIYNFWDTNNDKTIAAGDWAASPYRREDWDKYQTLRRSPESPKCLRLHRNAIGDYWIGDGLRVLSPTPALDAQANECETYNHLSYVIRQQYGGTTILHGGDASGPAWCSILEEVGPDVLRANLLVAPHHGSTNEMSDDALEALAVTDPDWVVISADEEADVDTHFYREMARSGVLTTRDNGNIRVVLPDAGPYEVYVDRQ